MTAFKDLTGQKFGKLTVIRRVVGKYTQAFWYCKCECGEEAVCNSGNLIKGHTQSCGCLHSEMLKSRNTTHGLRNHRLYRIWHGIHERCNSPYSVSYRNYGANGVKICKEWYDFKTFYDWAISNGWVEGLRIDKDIKAKDLGVEPDLYSPERCCWVTTKENNRHRKTTILTKEQANEIKSSKEKPKILMAKYGVGRGTIYNIRHGISWLD